MLKLMEPVLLVKMFEIMLVKEHCGESVRVRKAKILPFLAVTYCLFKLYNPFFSSG